MTIEPNMNNEIIKQLVFTACNETPSLVSDVITAATEGVKEFAKKQSDTSSKLAVMMSQILEVCPNTEFGPFSRKDILDVISPWFKGTPWFEKQNESK